MAGFRIERLIGRGSRCVVYEATQIGLDRRVALKLLEPDPVLDARLQSVQWPEHPHVVRLYAAGAWERGHFLAMQLVTGPTLAELHALGALDRALVAGFLSDVESALDAAHGAGIAHGAVSARNVLVGPGGQALLSDFGLAGEDPSAESDRAALQALSRELLRDAPRAWRRRMRRPRILAGIAALAGLAALVAWFARPADRAAQRAAPPVLAGGQALGSALAPAGVQSRDCEGRPPSGASQQCTLVQTRLPGRPLRAARSGAVRRWAVRGARGELALQVLRPRGRTLQPIARTPFVHLPDTGLHVLAASLPLRAGDRVGLQVAPGAAVGVRRTVPGAATIRLFGPLTFSSGRVPRGPGSGFDYEVLLRVEYLPGARARPPGLLTGAAAERAPAGRELQARDVEPRPGEVRTVALVALGDRVAVDLFAGGRRLVRLPVADASGRGRLLGFDTLGEPTVRLRWRNPGGGTVGHDYAVGSGSLEPVS